jgi:hypothetical protein
MCVCRSAPQYRRSVYSDAADQEQAYFNRDRLVQQQPQPQPVQSATLPRTAKSVNSSTAAFIRGSASAAPVTLPSAQFSRQSSAASITSDNRVLMSNSGNVLHKSSTAPAVGVEHTAHSTPKLLYSAKSYQDDSAHSSGIYTPSTSDILARRLDAVLTREEAGVRSPAPSGSGGTSSSSTAASTPSSGEMRLDTRATVSASSSCSAENAGALRQALMAGDCDTRPNTPRERSVTGGGMGRATPQYGADQGLRKSTADLSDMSRSATMVNAAGASSLVPPKSPSKCKSMEDLRQLKSGGVTANSGPDGTLPAPLNAAGLRPIRQKQSNAVVNIVDDGWVCLEFLKRRNGEDTVTDVMKISPDGLKVCNFTVKINE